MTPHPNLHPTPIVIRYAGVFIADGAVRRMVFEANGPIQANELALKWGIGIEGEAAAINNPEPIPEAYDVKTACRMLGGISRKSLDRDLKIGLLERVEYTRRVLVTRKSIERRVNTR
jgi:hypothetical protein